MKSIFDYPDPMREYNRRLTKALKNNDREKALKKVREQYHKEVEKLKSKYGI